MAGGKPAAYGVTFPMDGSDQFLAKMKYNQFSAYVQDQINFSDRFRLTAGLRIPVIASGGAGSAHDIAEVLAKGHADAALAASIFHYGEITIPELKQALSHEGIPVRL